MNDQPLRTVGDDVTPRDFRDAFAHFPSGVVAVCGLDDGKPIGFVVSSFTSASIDPPLLAVCIGNPLGTWQRLRENGNIGISVLSADHAETCRQLSSSEGDRFAGLDLHVTEGRAGLLNGAVAWFECEVSEEFPAGDHIIALLRIIAMQEFPERQPLVFHRSDFHKLRI
jgi:flavin reductase (DIM6/NTAB) family NADH-FMN oxidoreductase RutF